MERGEAPLLRLARSLTAAESPADFLRRLAAEVREEIDADWAAVWIRDRRSGRDTLETAVPRGLFEAAREGAGAAGDLLTEAATRRRPVVKRGGEIEPELLRHLAGSPRPPVREVFCLPFDWGTDRVGLLELIREKPSPPDRHDNQLHFLASCAAFVSATAASVRNVQTRRETQLGVINRLTQLYDVSRVFHSSLERDTLLPAIADRIRVIFEGVECRIWLPGENAERLFCAYPEGIEATWPAESGEEGIPWVAFRDRGNLRIGSVSESGEEIPVAEGTEPPGSILCSPLLVEESCLGAIEVVRRPGEEPFTEDDLDFLEEICRQAAAALRNANLFQAERKAEELGALLDVSREITATLNLDRVLLTVVNRAGSIVPADRFAILLSAGSRTELRAVSEQMEVNRKDPPNRALEEVLAWAYLSGQGIYVSELEGEIEADREETKEKFRRYFEKSGMKTFIALPLRDEEGLLGMLSIESGEPYSVSQEQLEVFNILVNQATVAIRNAGLYHQIPLIHIMQPIVGWKSRLQRMPAWKWARNGGIAAALLLLLVVVPWKMKVGGRVVVLPSMNSAVTAEVEGVVEEVLAREGERVTKGTVLARLASEEYRAAREEVRAEYEIASRDVARYEASLDPAAARQARIRRNQLAEELDLLEHRMDRTRIVSPVDGVVLTPRLDQKVGQFLERGDEFCRVADMREVQVEIRVPEAEIAEIEAGQRVRLKIDSFPNRTIPARVEIIGQKVIEEWNGRFLTVRANVDADGQALKSGMQGRAKILVGSRSIGYVLFRKPVRLLWRKVWSWLP